MYWYTISLLYCLIRVETLDDVLRPADDAIDDFLDAGNFIRLRVPDRGALVKHGDASYESEAPALETAAASSAGLRYAMAPPTMGYSTLSSWVSLVLNILSLSRSPRWP